MKEFYCYLKSDLYKLWRSGFFLLHLLFPIFGAVLILLYCLFSSQDNYSQLAGFIELLAIAFPFVISIVCQIAAEQELQAGHCFSMFTLPYRKRAFFSKFFILLLSGWMAVAFSVLLFGILFSVMNQMVFPVEFFLFLPMVLWLSNIFIYGLHFAFAFCFERNIGMSIGVIGSLLSALLQTGLGDQIWFAIPYGWGVRFAAYAFVSIFHFSSTTNDHSFIGAIVCTVATFGIIGFLAKGAEQWHTF